MKSVGKKYIMTLTKISKEQRMKKTLKEEIKKNSFDNHEMLTLYGTSEHEK